MSENPTQSQVPRALQRWELPLLLLVIAVGAAIRIWHLPRVPGLYYDEALDAIESLRIARGLGFPIFFDSNNHMREPLFMWIGAVFVWFGGASAVAFRATAVFIGIATIPAVWLLAREWSGARVAIIAAATLALMRWHIHFSALGFRTIMAPLCMTMVAWHFLRMARRRSPADAAWCGFWLGAGMYTYLAFRLMPLAMAIPAGLALWRCDMPRATLAKLYAIAAAAALVVFLPLGIDYARNPHHFAGRSDEVNFLNKPGGAALLLAQARDVALMPLVRGDHVGKHNLPGPPEFIQWNPMPGEEVAARWRDAEDAARAAGTPPPDPHGTGVPALPLAMGLVFYAGILATIRKAKGSIATLLLLSWLLVGSLASILSFGAPNMLRLVILTPVVALFCARAIEAMASSFPNEKRAMVLCATLLAAFGVIEFRRLAAWPKHPMVRQEFNVEMREIGDFLRAQPDRLTARLPFGAPPTLVYLADRYEFAEGEAKLPGRSWELQTLPPFPPLPNPSTPLKGGRSFEVLHPIGISMGRLVEVENQNE